MTDSPPFCVRCDDGDTIWPHDCGRYSSALIDDEIKRLKKELDDPNGTSIQYQPHTHMHAPEWGNDPNPEKCVVCYVQQPTK
jgi:hypothetical protein